MISKEKTLCMILKIRARNLHQVMVSMTEGIEDIEKLLLTKAISNQLTKHPVTQSSSLIRPKSKHMHLPYTYTYLHNSLIRHLRQLPLRHNMRPKNRPPILPPDPQLILRQRQKPLVALPMALRRRNAPHILVCTEHLAPERLEEDTHEDPS